MSSASQIRTPLTAFPNIKITRPPELVREFIHDCLYNQKKGFFEGIASILHTSEDAEIDFRGMKNRFAYLRAVQRLYEKGDQSVKGNHNYGFHPVWHTPSELFYPWYGQGIAEYAIRTRRNPQEKLIIYEIGPGNGTLCRSIINHLCHKYPETKVEYHLIEISSSLVRDKLLPIQQRHPDIITIHNMSFLDWHTIEPRSTLLLFPEVFDNLPQDRIRWADDGTLEQALVLTNDKAHPTDQQRKYTEAFVPATDPLIIQTVNVLEATGHNWPSTWRRHRDYLKDIWPLSAFFFPRPWSSEFIPTTAVSVLQHLSRYFPAHRLLITDFDALPDRIPGHGSPVVQTRYRGRTIACTTYLLERGLFDIFFAMDFNLLARIYRKLHPFTRQLQVLKHRDFCLQYMDVSQTTTRSGYNPLIDDYGNVSFLLANSHCPCKDPIHFK